MIQYISKTALVAWIRSRLHPAVVQHGTNYDDWDRGADSERLNILSFIDTLDVKENDLVEELDYDDYLTFFKEHPEYNNGDWGFEETWTFGQYCYKLGLKAQKSATNE